MDPTKSRRVLCAALASVLIAGCVNRGDKGTAEVDGGTPGSGGGMASGGSAGTGGAPGTGGRTGAGGATGAGGVTSTGGAPGAGGTPGAGGSSASGGRSGAGGSVADGGMDSGSDGAAAGYQPCRSNPCKILPLGDSITFGVNDEANGGYRGPLFADIVAAGQRITFTGSLTNGPTTVSGQPFPQRNEGHSGWGIAEVTPFSGGNAGIATLIPMPALSTTSGGTPDIILLHIGTNDATSFPAAQMETDLQGLLDKLFASAPNALVVLAQIIPLGYDPTNAVIRAYNQALPGIVQARAAAGKHIMLVDMNTGFSVTTMYGADKIHPNTAGYKVIADRWYAAIATLLPR
jgi:lysophospholipase L1-like esterase